MIITTGKNKMDYFNPDPKKKRIQLKGRAYTELRRKVWEKQAGRCADCGEWVPLKGSSVFDMAHLAHIKSKGARGDDTEENTRILCYFCHLIKEHGPQWSKKEGG